MIGAFQTFQQASNLRPRLWRVLKRRTFRYLCELRWRPALHWQGSYQVLRVGVYSPREAILRVGVMRRLRVTCYGCIFTRQIIRNMDLLIDERLLCIAELTVLISSNKTVNNMQGSYRDRYNPPFRSPLLGLRPDKIPNLVSIVQEVEHNILSM